MAGSKQNRHCVHASGPRGWLCGHGGQLCALACCAALAGALGAGLLRGSAQSAPAPVPTHEKTSIAPAAGQLQKKPAEIDAEQARKQEIARQSAELLKLAADLKAEVGRSTKDQLSVTVVRKASQIEQLARKVRTQSPKD
jgi:hypothetical protein